MLTCFLDESGCPGQLPTIASPIQPMLVIAGIALDTEAISSVTRQFARLTQRYHHGQSRPNEICADLQGELIKGAAVRRSVRSDAIAAELKELPLLDSLLSLLKTHRAKVFGTVILKQPGQVFDGKEVYGHGMLEVVRAFHETLVTMQTHGTAIADFRESKLNGRVSADLMDSKLGPAGDQLPRLLHLPTFGNSEVHAPLQMVDLLCSAIAWPTAAHRFRSELEGSPLVNPSSDASIRRRFRHRLLELMPESSRSTIERTEPGYRSVSLRSALQSPLANQVSHGNRGLPLQQPV